MSWSVSALAEFVQLFDPALARKGGGVLNKRDSEEDNWQYLVQPRGNFFLQFLVTKSGKEKIIILVREKDVGYSRKIHYFSRNKHFALG